MDSILLVIILLLLLIFIAFWLLNKNKSPELKNANDKFLLDISRRLDELKNITDKTGTELKDTVTARLDNHRDTVQKQLANDFNRSQKLIQDITQKMTEFKETNKTILNATGELKNLQNILLNPKHRGVFGEFQLESALENSFAPNHWQRQYRFKNGEIVDAVLFIKNKVLPIDSKFSLENYNRMIQTQTPADKQILAKQVKNDLKRRIDETAKYIQPSQNTLDFAFMFIPSEALYYDLLTENIGGQSSNQRDLIEYAFRDKKVIIVSPTTFAAYLQTVLQGLRALQIEKDAVDIQKKVEQLARHLSSYSVYMIKLGNTINTVTNHYNNASSEFRKIDKDIVKITHNQSQLDNDNPVINKIDEKSFNDD